jgi:hypothetical protein
MGKILDPALQDYFNGICCNNTTPQGKITLTGGIADGLYTDLTSAIAWLQTFTSATITDASLVGDVFKFTVPAGSDFSLDRGFLAGVAANIQDPDGLIVKFGNKAFQNNSGDNLLLNVEFGDNAFENSNGINTITNILLTNSTHVFANSYTGTINISGNIGNTEGNDYINFFPGASGATINVLASKQTSDGGNVEGDILLAQNNGATVNFTL